jgi:anti-sigma B factor antagonist
MQIEVRKEGKATILVVKGKVNIQTAPKLHDEMEKHAKPKHPLVICLSGVEYMDSSGVGVLVTGLRYATGKKVPFALSDLHERVRSVLELTRLTKIFDIYDDVPAALEALGGTS